MSTQAQSSIVALDQAHHIHPFNNLKQIKAQGVRVITAADGIFITDDQGKRYIDAMAGLWCVNIGYGRHELVAAAADQMIQLPYYNTFFQSTTAPAAKLAAKLTQLTPPNINHVFFANSGSEANDTIVRMVRTYWELMGLPARKNIISRQYSYHGSTLVCSSLCGLDYMHPTADLPLPGFHHIMNPYHYRYGGEMDAAEFGLYAARALEEKILELGPETVAAFHADTVASGGGVIVPPDSYWPEIVRICQKYNILLSIDEVISGFGRIGAWLSTELYGLQPDFISVAKGLSSGYLPISAALVSDRVADVFVQSGQNFNHGFTYSGHPASAAVALENIRLLDAEGIIERVAADTGPYFQARLRECADHPLVGEVRGRGLIAAVEMVADKATKAPFSPAGSAGQACFAHCLDHGLISRPLGDIMAFSPPLIISRAEIDEVIDIFKRCLDLTAATLGR